MRSIISTGEITPNTGQFAVSSVQSPSSWSRRLGGVSPFYFLTMQPTVDMLERLADHHFAPSSPCVMIKTDPSQSEQSLLYLPRIRESHSRIN